MVDRTPLFVSLTSRVAIDGGGGSSSYSKQHDDEQGKFLTTANEVRRRIQGVHHVLMEVVEGYTNYSEGMSEEERDRIDLVISDGLAEVDMLMKSLGSSDIVIIDGEEDAIIGFDAFKRAVIGMLRQSLRAAQEAANKRRVWRQQHALESRDKLVPTFDYNTTISDNVMTSAVRDDDDDDNEEEEVPPETIIVTDDANTMFENLTAEEVQELELENHRLELQLRSELEEARAVERTAVEVSQLLQAFSEKVVDQRDMIENIHHTAMESVVVVDKVPDELEQATERSASFRRMLLGFLFISALLLLVLDWLDT